MRVSTIFSISTHGNFKWECLDHLSEAQRASMLDGTDFLRLPTSCKQRSVHNTFMCWRVIDHECKCWLSCLRIGDAVPTLPTRLDMRTYLADEVLSCQPCNVGDAVDTSSPDVDFHLLESNHPILHVYSGVGTSTLIEDKDPSVLWKANTSRIMLRWRQQFEAAHQR